MVIKFPDKLDIVRSAIIVISFPGHEMPSVSADGCQIDARKEHSYFWHDLTASLL